MNRVLTNSEFFAYESEVWIRSVDGTTRVLLDSDYEVVKEVVEHISVFYPKAYEALCEEYRRCSPNPSYFRYRIACRFIKCNLGALDSIPDITSDRHFKMEHINCPLRGECRYENVICRPQFDHQLSRAEIRVMKLVYNGLSQEIISEQLMLSPHTVHTHIRNAYTRLGIHSKAEFIKYASSHHLFS